jgi:N-acetyl-anhydromuramyl-L-alanine amidase AmpD
MASTKKKKTSSVKRRTGASNRHSTASRRRRKKRNRQILLRLIVILAVSVVVFAAVRHVRNNKTQTGAVAATPQKTVTVPPEFSVDLLEINEYSRPGLALDSVNGIVIHYTANPGTTAQQNRDYFEGLKDSHDTKASSHFVIGLEGEIIQCIPTAEMAYASNDRNSDTLAIECCIPDETGAFNQSTYDSLVHLTAWLCGKFDLTTEQVIRHYDVTGKNCPKYYVEHEDAWEQFKTDVNTYIDTYGVVEESEEE